MWISANRSLRSPGYCCVSILAGLWHHMIFPTTAESIRGSGYLFFTVISFRPWQSVWGQREWFFSTTVREPALTREEEGQIMPWISGWERWYNQLGSNYSRLKAMRKNTNYRANQNGGYSPFASQLSRLFLQHHQQSSKLCPIYCLCHLCVGWWEIPGVFCQKDREYQSINYSCWLTSTLTWALTVLI